eukprot:1161008-Pelagomonas_calceolata.AAC.2
MQPGSGIQATPCCLITNLLLKFDQTKAEGQERNTWQFWCVAHSVRGSAICVVMSCHHFGFSQGGSRLAPYTGDSHIFPRGAYHKD